MAAMATSEQSLIVFESTFYLVYYTIYAYSSTGLLPAVFDIYPLAMVCAMYL